MKHRPVYEEHFPGPLVRAQAASEKSGQLQAACAAAHDHDLVLHPETIPAASAGCEKTSAPPPGPDSRDALRPLLRQ
ncbi:hypothetical protein D3C85_520410 [compost metagenome]